MDSPPSPEALDRAARHLLSIGLRLEGDARLVVLGDASTQAVLDAIERAARALGAEPALFRLDQLVSHASSASGDRPHKILPEEITRAMARADASVFVAAALHGEAAMRDQLQRLVAARGVRHAHLPDVDARAFASGLAQHDRIAAAGAALARRLDLGREITSTSRAGTNLVIHPGARRWIPRLGAAEPGETTFFPAGSLIVAPESTRGTFAATASLGEFFGAREGRLREPLLFEIEDGVVTRVRAAGSGPGSKELVRDVEAMLSVAANSNRVGLVVLGVNEGCPEPLGVAAVDQHRPGLHLVFGDPQAKVTEAGWSARTTFAACQAASTVQVDGVVVCEDGRLTGA